MNSRRIKPHFNEGHDEALIDNVMHYVVVEGPARVVALR